MTLEKITVLYVFVAIVGAGIGLAVLTIVCKFLHWAAITIWTETLKLVDQIAETLIEVTTHIFGGTKNMLETILHILWSGFLTGLLWLTQPIKSRAVKCRAAIAEYCKLRQLYWKYGYNDFKSFKAFKRHMLGEEEPQQQKQEPKKGSFEEALEIMGFTGDQLITQTELKARYRQLISTLHPDKGFPNTVFAQQVNEAFAVIMKVKKWK